MIEFVAIILRGAHACVHDLPSIYLRAEIRACLRPRREELSRSIDPAISCQEKKRETDRPTDVRFGLGILQSWLGSLHAIKKVHCGKGW